MRVTTATRAAVAAFKSVYLAPSIGTVGSSYGAESAYWSDWFRNGWAAVSSAWDAFWGSLRQWGGTDYKALATAAAANPSASRALRLICDNGAAVPLVGYRTKGTDKEEAQDLPGLEAILRTGWGVLFAAYIWGLYCGGEAFFHRAAPTGGPNAGRVRYVRDLPNERLVEIKYDALGDPTTYVFQREGGRGGTDEYPADEVLHVKLFNPLDRKRGLPILIGARRALTLMEEGDAWNRGIAQGGGRVPGFFKPTGLEGGSILPPETVRAAQEQSDAAMTERRRKDLPQVLSGAFDFQTGSVTPRDAQGATVYDRSERQVGSVSGVSAVLLSSEKAGSLTDAGVDSEIAALLKLTIQPRVHDFLSALTAWLCEDGESIEADWDQVPALQEDMDAKYDRYEGAVTAGLLTKKEGRVAIGYDAVPTPEMTDDVAPPQPPAEDDTDPFTRSLKGMPGDAYDELLAHIPQATA